MLFHGTRENKPELIYNGEEGFNMLHSEGGMWGKAIYFAQNSSYSHAYRYRNVANGTRQIFFARVLVGQSIALPAD